MCIRTTAKIMASTAHCGQKYGDGDFVSHPAEVVRVLRRHGVSEDAVLAAGWLHDIIEDSSVTFSFIKLQVGLRVAEAVYAVTDELGRNRHERLEKTLPKIVANPDAILVKLADRIANISHGLEKKSKLLGLYCESWDKFRGAVSPHCKEGAALDLFATLETLIERAMKEQGGDG